MNPGTLDQRVVIQSETRTADDYGGAATTWGTFATVWAGVRPTSGRERAEMGLVEAPALYRFTLRRRDDITEAMRLSWNGQTWNIRFIGDPGSRSLYMTIDAERGVGQ
jgi:SPP1 family predicted phage head-tail adaptor